MNSQKIRKCFSDCGSYRWWLERQIGSEKEKLLFIGLNPSTASNLSDDMTLKRLMGFCRAWKYGTLVVINLFAKVSKSPSSLKLCSDPVGIENDSEIKSRLLVWANNSDWNLWLGWGAMGVYKNRNSKVLNFLEFFSKIRVKKLQKSLGPMVIGCTKGGHPMHPLYVSRSKVLMPYKDFLI
ncbi:MULTISPECIES: DUF1643 domain-containing protein [Prochlorococcus]|uniref:DUF1643 domain-containing protein n=1 Tax=Prochlorococcus TaxID=1218 RepID=UPI0005338EE6|nr:MULTISPECIES: DUF1643 domain-containing protein [Prochlorococcus]KGG12921.1 hypothetical protein EV05_0594 [Prochlorococcus sp. MIT 0601]